MRAVAAVVQLVARNSTAWCETSTYSASRTKLMLLPMMRARWCCRAGCPLPRCDEFVIAQPVMTLPRSARRRPFDPQAKQVVGQVAVAHHGAVRAGVDVDAGVLVDGLSPESRTIRPSMHTLGRGDADGVAAVAAADGGAVPCRRSVSGLSMPAGWSRSAALDLDHIARLRRARRACRSCPGARTTVARAARRRQASSQRRQVRRADSWHQPTQALSARNSAADQQVLETDVAQHVHHTGRAVVPRHQGRPSRSAGRQADQHLVHAPAEPPADRAHDNPSPWPP